MNTPKIEQNFSTGIEDDKSERGTAIVIALFVLALIGAFVALALSRTASEAAGVGNETSEARTLYAAQGGLETMTRNFNKIFETKLNPTAGDIALVRNPDVVPGLSKALGGEYDFEQGLLCVRGISPDCVVRVPPAESTVVLSDGSFSGLYAIRDNWRLQSTAAAPDGTQLELTRNILNNRIPIFQFGIFYDDDLELYRPPRFSFGGRVHSNGNFFVSPGSEGVYFNSRVTAHQHIVTQSWRNWHTGDNYSGTYIKDAEGDDQQLLRDRGSVLNGSPSVFTNTDLPPSVRNPNWAAHRAIFDGNLQSEVPELKLPLKVQDADVANPISLIEMIKRGKEPATAAGGDLESDGDNAVPVTTGNEDNPILRSERFANKTGIRISLADSKAKLPGCASGNGILPITGPCGVRLDGHIDGHIGGPTQWPLPGPTPTPTPERSRGYEPKPMTDGYQATRVNGERLHTGGREVWIKVETVQTNDTTGEIETQDITEDILSLGVTEQALNLGSRFSISGYNHTAPGSSLLSTTPQPPSIGTDSRSVIKIQRFLIPGPAIPGDPTNPSTSYLTPVTTTGLGEYNAAVRFSGADSTEIGNGCPIPGCTVVDLDPNTGLERFGHLKHAQVNGGAFDKAVVPFPIEMFDMREGLYYDQRNTTFYPDNASAFDNFRKISRNGIMSLIDIDVANLRRFLRGDFNGRFPTDTTFALAKGEGLEASWAVGTESDIPSNGGWVLYVSDRRGDADFDGEFDMEDVYGQADGDSPSLQLGEDVNGSGTLDNTTDWLEGERYRTNAMYPDLAAADDHSHFRRGVRLINGTTIPGIYDSVNASRTMGFTVSSENGVYVYGNYNATHVTSVPATGNTPYNNYRPFNDPTHIPASIVADGVTILSNSKYIPGSPLASYTNGWNDAKSFAEPYDLGSRRANETTIRFAMISGDTISTRQTDPHQGGISPRLNGGVHNFKRFLERWTDPGDSSFRQNLNYSGSLINLFYSRANNGSFKCCNMVYNPPVRNWVFDSTFLDPGRLPPGTPFFQYVQTTGFQRSTD